MYLYGFADLLEDDSILMVLFALSYDDLPDEKGCVRMNAFGGFKFTPLPDNPNKCMTEFVLSCDLKCIVPNSIISKVLDQSAHGLCTIQNMLPKWIE